MNDYSEMKVKDHQDWNPEFPENFTWEWLDSNQLSGITCAISTHIANDLKRDRNYVPGLRAALVVIADVANL